MRFTKDIGLFQIEVEIQSQRYYKDKNTKQFQNKITFCFDVNLQNYLVEN